MTTREQSFSTMSKRCVLNRIMRPSARTARERAEQQAGVDIEAGERFVKHEERRVVQQSRRQQHALAHALRERATSCGSGCREAATGAAGGTILWSARVGEAAEPADQHQVFGGGQVRVEVRLFRDVADPPLVGDRMVVEPHVVERESPALGSSRPTTRLTVVLLPDPFGPR